MIWLVHVRVSLTVHYSNEKWGDWFLSLRSYVSLVGESQMIISGALGLLTIISVGTGGGCVRVI